MKKRETGKTVIIVILALMTMGLIWYGVSTNMKRAEGPKGPATSTTPYTTSTPPLIEETKYSSILLYFHNSSKDPRADICSRDAVFPVARMIPKTQIPIQDAVNLLLQGELTADEKKMGFTTEFPLKGFTLVGANLKDGVLTLEFRDPNNLTVGGSCRVGILWAQIEKTTKQFSGVNEVRFIPEEIFQP